MIRLKRAGGRRSLAGTGPSERAERPGGARRVLLIGLTAALAAAAAAAVGHGISARPRATATASPPIGLGTAIVTRGDVVARQEVTGTLGFDGSYPVVSQLPPGVLTQAPAPGTTITRGHALFQIAGVTVRLLYGHFPAYRAFTPSMSDGPDVGELNANLIALGMDPGAAIAAGDQFQVATEAAILRWQAALGLPIAEQTGTIPCGQVAFLPGAMRVSQSTPVGSDIGPGVTVLSATSTRQVVTAPVTTDQEQNIRTGDQVLVSVPSGAQVSGTVSAVGRVASAASGPGGTTGATGTTGASGTTGAGSAGGSGGAGSSGGPGGSAGTATVTITVHLTVPPSDANLDQAPVQVAITTQRSLHVLMLPITALLARPGGGYQVRVAGGATRRLVAVQPGLFDDLSGTVQISGPGITAGTRVEVPAS